MKPYRGIPIKGGDFVYGGLTEVMDSEGDAITLIATVDTSCNRIDGEWVLRDATEVIPSTVGQQVGLTDKNGKEIYHKNKLRSGKRILVVVWDKDKLCWMAKEEGVNYLTPLGQWAISEQFEIIGNIHTENNNGKENQKES